MLPIEVPPDLARDAVLLESMVDSEAGWTIDGALQVLDSLDRTWVAICGVQGYASSAMGLMPSPHNWSCEPLSGETASEFARRSRSGAAEYIRSLPTDEVALVGLEFQGEDAA